MISKESETTHKNADTVPQTNRCHQRLGVTCRLVTVSIALLVLIGGRSAAQAPATSYSVLYNFTGGSDGGDPGSGTLVQDAAGNLYGTTDIGGDSGCGALYKWSTDGTESVLHAFNCHSDGRPSFYGVTISGNTLYGTAAAGGGPGGHGALFAVDIPTGIETELYNFPSGDNGVIPSSGLVQDKAGNLYGCTAGGGHGGDGGNGVIYRFDPSTKTYTVLYKFTGGADGSIPGGNLTLDASGTVLYGVTGFGGASGLGVVFSLMLQTDTYSVLHSFTGPDGGFPNGSLIIGQGGVLFGTTIEGGNAASSSGSPGDGYGVIFKILPSTGQETALYMFTGGVDGRYPFAGVVLTKTGNLIGTTHGGGANGIGTIFEVDPTTKTETVLHTFDVTDGAFPVDGLFQDPEGNFYGTTYNGGSRNLGVIFKLTP